MSTIIAETHDAQGSASSTGTAAEPSAEPVAQDQQLEPRTKLSASIGFGMSANNWQQGLVIAKALAQSALVPKNYQNHPEDIVVAMQMGAELGLPPMQALQSIAVINGRPGVYGDGFLGVVMSSPTYAKHEEFYRVDGERRDVLTTGDLEHDDTTAVSVFWRRGNQTPFQATFSIGDAKRAGLWGKQGPWQQYPARMLRLRARGFAGRDAFAAELRGLRTAEELLDTPPVEDLTPPAEPVRRSEKPRREETHTHCWPASDEKGEPGPPGEPRPAPVVQHVTLSPAPASAGTSPAPATAPTTRNGAATAKGSKKAAPAPPASAARFPQVAPSVVTKAIAITDTQVISPRDAPPYYEIKGRVSEKGQAPIGFTWYTESEALYKAAASCEGSESKVHVTWHGSQKPDGTGCKVITSIEAAE